MSKYNSIKRREFIKILLYATSVILTTSYCNLILPKYLIYNDTNGGWKKYRHNPILGGDYGTCFDCFVSRIEEVYRMWFSWRPKKSIALVESIDGVSWSQPKIVLSPNIDSGWEDEVNRPSIVKIQDLYHMWYTGQTRDYSRIGYAQSTDGVSWNRISSEPILGADVAWEKDTVMCPHVIYDYKQSQFRMWYSGGDQNEPDSIGYAASKDGINWSKNSNNPIFLPDKKSFWESYKVTGCFVIQHGEYYYMFYIGFSDEFSAQIGLARSKDGISDWKRFPGNPIIGPGISEWDEDAVYKPSVIFEGNQWRLWYNGRKDDIEQIGMAIHIGEDLGFS